MTFLGKIFSVVIALLSLTFMVLALVANASHRNWRNAVVDPEMGLKKRVADVEQTNRQLQDSRMRVEGQLSREQASRRTALASLQTQLDQLKDQLQVAEGRLQQVQAQNSELVQTDRSRADQLARLTEDNKNLEQSIIAERADRDQLFAKSLELTDQVNEALGLLDTMKTVNENLVTDLSRYKEVLDARGINVSDPIDGAPPERNGEVLAVNRQSSMVEVSIGYDEGLREGHELLVTRGGRYLGKVKVRYTLPDSAVADILGDYLEGPIQRGDRVDTTLE